MPTNMDIYCSHYKEDEEEEEEQKTIYDNSEIKCEKVLVSNTQHIKNNNINVDITNDCKFSPHFLIINEHGQKQQSYSHDVQTSRASLINSSHFDGRARFRPDNPNRRGFNHNNSK